MSGMGQNMPNEHMLLADRQAIGKSAQHQIVFEGDDFAQQRVKENRALKAWLEDDTPLTLPSADDGSANISASSSGGAVHTKPIHVKE